MKKLNIPFERVDWINTIFLLVITLTGVIGAPLYLWHHGADAFQWGMFAFYAIATGMSITLGYHRLFSHLSFKAKWPVRLFTLVFGACAFENSALNWCSDHRRHHKHTDHDDDPYDITKGFFWAHVGWILFKVNPKPPMDNVGDLRKDKLVVWQYRWDKLIAIVVGLLLPAALGYWHNGAVGALGGFLLAGVLRIVVVQQCTFFINSLCHTVGDQPYSTRCSARDSAIMALFTFGEGYHNYHHEFQHDYRNGVKTWNFDPTKWAIWLLEKVGLVSNLRRVPDSKILLAQMKEAQRKANTVREGIEGHHDPAWREKATEIVDGMIAQLAKNYHELEEAASSKMELSKKAVRNWRAETRSIVAQLGKMRQITPSS
ncbi:acyl-CoA desaturase [Sulfuriroseicoccus oceanibius]|uniref:Fatty acid desaturase n=1 Tax=Sulfuriroseicoccus oceanibius TaxID=2707525 RepID=A0A6B3L3U1_9BACT|nr:fatty acid desaturase [Sulfuriroseicoccus oceanibius]QQL46155.1 fatty acid desaturase [Sulfuriroseicoccus oceanibius]